VILPYGAVHKMSCGVPQGSVLGSILWNLFYNKVLKENRLKNVQLIAYADDLAIITTAKTKSDLEIHTELVVTETASVLQNLGLDGVT